MPDETRAAATENTPTARRGAEPAQAEPDEPRYPLERWLDAYADLGRELERPTVTRGSVAGSHAKLARERKSHMPKTLTRSEQLAALVDYLDAPEER